METIDEKLSIITYELENRFPALDLRYNFQPDLSSLRLLSSESSETLLEINLSLHCCTDLLNQATLSLKTLEGCFDA